MSDFESSQSRNTLPIKEQLEPILSIVFLEIQAQSGDGLTLTAAVQNLARALSCRYRVPVEDADLLVCISAIHSIATSLMFSSSGDPPSEDRSVRDSFVLYALAIVDVEDCRRNRNSVIDAFF